MRPSTSAEIAAAIELAKLDVSGCMLSWMIKCGMETIGVRLIFLFTLIYPVLLISSLAIMHVSCTCGRSRSHVRWHLNAKHQTKLVDLGVL